MTNSKKDDKITYYDVWGDFNFKMKQYKEADNCNYRRLSGGNLQKKKNDKKQLELL